MRMDRNHSTGPVVDLSAIAATFPGENFVQPFYFLLSLQYVFTNYYRN